MKAIAALAALMFCVTVGSSRAQRIEFDPRSYQDMVTQPTEVLVLGSPHLQNAPDDWDPAALDALLERLAAFRPRAIMVEALPGESIDLLWRYRATYPDTASNYGWRSLVVARYAQLSLEMDAPQAEAELRRVLAAWSAQPTPAERRRLATLFAAAGDPNSALVQWWRLDPNERIGGDGMTRSLIAELDALAATRNEAHLVGARLAARLGLERIYPIDDHSADDSEAVRAAELETFFSAGWVQNILNDPRRAALREAAEHLRTPSETLETYRLVNRGGAVSEAGMLDQYLRTMLPRGEASRVGRVHLATLEARNLRQVANIREALSSYPGERVLVIIGFSHKAWFEAYLRGLADVHVVSVDEILGASSAQGPSQGE